MSSSFKRNCLFWAIIVLVCVPFMRVEMFAQGWESYEVQRVPFTVLDKDRRPCFGYSLGVRLDPTSPNLPEDEIISAGEVSYGRDEDYKKYGPIDKEGKIEIPFIVYREREDCIGYDIALFSGEEQVDPKPQKECFALGKAEPITFIASIRLPTPSTTWLKSGVLFLILVGFVIFGIYKPLYSRQLKGSNDPQEVENFRHRATSLLLFFLAVSYGVVFFVLLPHTTLVWIIFVLLAVLWLLHFVIAVLF
jgi:hypothetical protein